MQKNSHHSTCRSRWKLFEDAKEIGIAERKSKKLEKNLELI